MALALDKTLYNGVTTSYHRVTKISLDPDKRTAVATLDSFANSAHRALPVPSHNSVQVPFVWSGNASTVLEEAYAHIKSLPEWQNAVDI